MGVLVLRTIIARLMPSHRVHTRPARGDATPVRLSESPETLARYLEDAAHYPGGHTVGVAHPETEAEAAAVVRQAQRLLPIGAQSSLTGGATPMGEVVLTTERLDRIVELGDTEVTVQAGVPLTVLRETLEQRGALYPPIPTFEGRSRVGSSPPTRQAPAPSSTAARATGSDASRSSSLMAAFST